MQAPDPTSFPTWMLWFAFIASGVLTIVKIVESLFVAANRPKLEVRLTKEIEFRVLGSGDSIFANAVLLARNGPLLISDTTMILSKIDGAQKQYPLEIVRFGEKVRSTGPIADNHFFTTSPLSFLPADVPQRVLYLSSHQEYKDTCNTLFNDFYDWAWQKKAELADVDTKALAPNDATELLTDVRSEIKEQVSVFMDELQIEPGKYRLTLTVKSKGVGAFSRETEQSSSIEFSVSKDVRERFRAQLPTTMEVLLGNILAPNQARTPIYPSYEPSDVSEV